MKIKYVEISNILSIKEIRLDFQQSGLVLLDGYNHDDDTANGAGKTAIFNSLCFGLFAKLPRKISASEILREGTKSGYVKVGIDTDSGFIEVQRTRPNNLKFWIDSVEKNMTQEEFEGHIKMNYSQFLISMYSAQTEGSKLISLNDTGKKDFFLQLMNLDSFDDCKKEIDSTIKDLYGKKVKIETSITELKARINSYAESLVDETEILEDIRAIDIVSLRASIEKYSNLIKPDIDKFDTLEEKLANEYRAVQSREDNNSYLIKEIERINTKIHRLSQKDKISCPHCSSDFIPGQDIEMKELIDLRKTALSELIEEDFSERKKELKTLIIKCRNKIAKQLEQYNEAQEQKAILSGQLAAEQLTLRGLNSMLDSNKVLNQRIEDNLGKLSKFTDMLNSIEEEIVLNETVSTIFSPTGAPAYVLDSAIDVFNERVAHYTSMIWNNASYVLLSFRENKSGELKAKFSEKLIISGKEKSLGALSGGEHRCLSLAVDFAVIDVLETMFGISMNPIMLDEPFNDLDASNRERVLDLLEKISVNRQIWVIDHASESKSMFSNVVKVEKRSGISSIVI